MNHLARMPNDDFLRASTIEGTITPIHVAHELSVSVNFQTIDENGVPGPERILTSETSIKISSVSSFFESDDRLVLIKMAMHSLTAVLRSYTFDTRSPLLGSRPSHIGFLLAGGHILVTFGAPDSFL